jgi:hypothetical protein
LQVAWNKERREVKIPLGLPFGRLRAGSLRKGEALNRDCHVAEFILSEANVLLAMTTGGKGGVKRLDSSFRWNDRDDHGE